MKVLVTDFDLTLYDDNYEKNLEYLKTLKDIEVIINTGREHITLFEDLKIECNYYILGDGSYIMNKNKEVIYTKILIITVKIKYRQSLRRLQDNSESRQAECTLLDNKFENIDNFNCTLETNGEEIENMQIEKYDFKDQQVSIIGETSISKAYKNNLQNVGDNDIFNKKLYILDNATRSIDNENNEFNITGTINDKSFNYENVKLSLNSKNEDEKPQEISCKVIKKDDNNYILNYKTDDQMKAELDGVFADLGNENLIVNFIDEGNSTINFEQNYNGIIFSKKKKGLSSGAIAGIVIACCLALIIAVSLAICLRKKKEIITTTQETSSNRDITSANFN